MMKSLLKIMCIGMVFDTYNPSDDTVDDVRLKCQGLLMNLKVLDTIRKKKSRLNKRSYL